METFVKILNGIPDTGFVASELRDTVVSRVVAETCPDDHYPEVRGEVPPIEPPNSKYAYRYEQKDGYVLKTYKAVPANYTYCEYSKMKVVVELMNAGVWETVKTVLQGSGYYDIYLAAQCLRANDPFFVAMRSMIKDALGWTDDQVSELLDKCFME